MSAGVHEQLVSESIELPSNRKFGLTIGLVFIAIASLRGYFIHFLPLEFLLLGTGFLFSSLGVLYPNSLSKLNKKWMQLGLLLFNIVNPIVMFVVYSLVFVPFGLVMRVCGYDPLKRHYDHDLDSYWQPKPKTEVKNPMKYQF